MLTARQAPDSTTPFGVTGTSAFALGVQGMIKIATILGRPSDAAEYASLNEKILSAFQKTFFNTTDGITYGSGSQCCDAIALNIGAVSSNNTKAVYDHFISSIRNNGSHLSVGEVGLPPFFDTLTSGGYNDVLFDVMSGTTNPSYGYQVVKGATSLGEYWNGPTGTGSQDHFMLGYGDTWIYGLAGMKQSSDSVGWQAIDFEPVLVGDVTHANATYESVKGSAAASWSRSGHSLTYTVQVPVGATGRVCLPGSEVELDGVAVQNHTDALSVNHVGDRTVVRVGSGTWHFLA